MEFFRDLSPVLWDEWVQFRRNFFKITTSSLIGPILYMIAFGFGIGGGSGLGSVAYMRFLIPGIIAMATMNGSYKAISVKLITNRVYDKTLEQFLIAPISIISFCIGKSLAGALRGLYAGGLVICVALAFGVRIHIDLTFVGLMFLNGLTFGTLGLLGALVAKSHADMNRFGTFVILPMSFLCGTFFDARALPEVFRQVISVLPLTHVATSLRAIANYDVFYFESILIVFSYWIIFLVFSYRICQKIST